jgi:hypothetical protein
LRALRSPTTDESRIRCADPIPKGRNPEAANTPESCCRRRVDQHVRREEGDTNYCARAGNYCHTLRDCVVTQSPQAACSRSTDVLCWRLQQRPIAAVHVCCKHTHAQVGNFDHSGSLLCTAVAHKSSKLPKHFDVADQKTPLSSSFSSPFPICSLSRLHCGR